MTLFITIFGALVCLAGLVILVNPEMVFGLLRSKSDKIGLHVLAVLTRLVLGAFLVIQAAASRYPAVIVIIGWIAIVAAVVLALMGRNNFSSLMAWLLSQVKIRGRLGGLLATAFGAFLVYAFI